MTAHLFSIKVPQTLIKLKTDFAKQWGLVEGVEVDVTYTSGPHVGETFSGRLSAAVTVGEPVYLDDHDEVTSEVKEITHEEGPDFSLVLVSGSTCVLTKKIPKFKTRSDEKPTVFF